MDKEKMIWHYQSENNIKHQHWQMYYSCTCSISLRKALSIELPNVIRHRIWRLSVRVQVNRGAILAPHRTASIGGNLLFECNATRAQQMHIIHWLTDWPSPAMFPNELRRTDSIDRRSWLVLLLLLLHRAFNICTTLINAHHHHHEHTSKHIYVCTTVCIRPSSSSSTTLAYRNMLMLS